MSVVHVEFLVEEPSMEEALRLLASKILAGLSFQVYPYQCKEDLLSRLPQRLRGYARWLPQGWRIVVVVDRDDDDCHQLKACLERSADEAGLITRTKAESGVYTVVNRLVIEELEAWYFSGTGRRCAQHIPGFPAGCREMPPTAIRMRFEGEPGRHSNGSYSGQGISREGCERSRQPGQLLLTGILPGIRRPVSGFSGTFFRKWRHDGLFLEKLRKQHGPTWC